MIQTEARRTLKDAPIMWRRINSIGVIIDCNSTYAAKLQYAKSEIIGKTVFEHVPKESWDGMTKSLTRWFETGKVTDQKIVFLKEDGTKFPGLLQATSIYDRTGVLMGSNTAIFDLEEMAAKRSLIKTCNDFIRDANRRLEDIRREQYEVMDDTSKSEYDGLRQMFEMLAGVDLAGMVDDAA